MKKIVFLNVCFLLMSVFYGKAQDDTYDYFENFDGETVNGTFHRGGASSANPMSIFTDLETGNKSLRSNPGGSGRRDGWFNLSEPVNFQNKLVVEFDFWTTAYAGGTEGQIWFFAEDRSVLFRMFVFPTDEGIGFSTNPATATIEVPTSGGGAGQQTVTAPEAWTSLDGVNNSKLAENPAYSEWYRIKIEFYTGDRIDVTVINTEATYSNTLTLPLTVDNAALDISAIYFNALRSGTVAWDFRMDNLGIKSDLANDNSIVSLAVNGVQGVINHNSNLIEVELPVEAEFTVIYTLGDPMNATANFASGARHNFANGELTVAVTAGSGKVKTYTVHIQTEGYNYAEHFDGATVNGTFHRGGASSANPMSHHTDSETGVKSLRSNPGGSGRRDGWFNMPEPIDFQDKLAIEFDFWTTAYAGGTEGQIWFFAEDRSVLFRMFVFPTDEGIGFSTNPATATIEVPTSGGGAGQQTVTAPEAWASLDGVNNAKLAENPAYSEWYRIKVEFYPEDRIDVTVVNPTLTYKNTLTLALTGNNTASDFSAIYFNALRSGTVAWDFRIDNMGIKSDLEPPVKPTDNSIAELSINGVQAEISHVSGMIAVDMPDAGEYAVTYTLGDPVNATADFVSGTVYDFSNGPLLIAVTSGVGEVKTHTVYVRTVASGANNGIYELRIAGYTAEINYEAGTVTADFPREIGGIGEFTVVYALNDVNATANFASGSKHDFSTGSFVITVTAQNGDSKAYTVSVAIAAVECVITFDPTLGELPDDAPDAINVIERELIGTMPVPLKKGWAFLGWNTMPDGSGEYLYATTQYAYYQDITLYAQWEINTYTLSFNSRADGVAHPESRRIVYGNPVGELPVISRPGNYAFVGWNTSFNNDGEQYTADRLYVEDTDVTLYATWILQTNTPELERANFMVYPNPAADIVYISGLTGGELITFFDLAVGRQWSSIKASGDKEENTVNTLPKGAYLVKIVKEKIEKTVKLIVN